MTRVRPSEATHAALRAACGQTVGVVLVPEGYWHEYLPELKAYEPGSVRFEMKSGSVLELWPECVQPISDPRCEAFVLAARYRAATDVPWMGAAAAVDFPWQRSPPLSQVIAERTISSFEHLDEENVWFDEEVVLASKGVRLNLPDGGLEMLVNLQPAALFLCAANMPEYRSAPTGEIQWLSRTFKRPAR